MKTSSQLIYRTHKVVSGERIEVEIALGDPCKNGHEDFSITGDIYKHTKTFNTSDKYHLAGGCIHDIILKHFPEFKMFVDLHLCDFKGAPMYALANGFYHMKSDLDKGVNYLRASHFSDIDTAEDEKHLSFLIETTGLSNKWKEEADTAIAELERLTGEKFESKATRSHFEPLSKEDFNEIERRLESGYYSPENKAKRAEDARLAAYKKREKEINSRYDNKELSIRQDRDISLEILRITGNLSSNFIFYNHSNKLVFNWQDHDYNGSFTEDEINKFKEEAKLDWFIKEINNGN